VTEKKEKYQLMKIEPARLSTPFIGGKERKKKRKDGRSLLFDGRREKKKE